MAGAVVGQAFLSAFLDVVFDKLASPEVVNFIRGKKLGDNLLQRLKTTLYAVEAVLNDAELKQIKDSAVNKWLDDLKDAVYEADDLLDHVSTKAATRKKFIVQDPMGTLLNCRVTTPQFKLKKKHFRTLNLLTSMLFMLGPWNINLADFGLCNHQLLGSGAELLTKGTSNCTR